jgi:hypothetical protein
MTGEGENREEGLQQLDAALQVEVGDDAYGVLVEVFGLHDGPHPIDTEAARQRVFGRPRAQPLLDLPVLRREGSRGRQLVSLVRGLLPPVGFAAPGDLVEALSLFLPVGGDRPISIPGYLRLALRLADPDGHSDAPGPEIALRPPWTAPLLDRLRATLWSLANWPPAPRSSVAAALWDLLPEPLERSLVRAGADAGALLDGLLRLDSPVRFDRYGGLYTPPVALPDALSRLRGLAGPRASASAWIAEACETWEGVSVEGNAEEALLAAGLRPEGDHWVDPSRVEAVELIPPLRLDANIPRQRAGPEAALVGSLVSSAGRGGFRVVAMPPGVAHRLGRELAGWLAAELGEERVSYIDLDRALIEGIKAAELWDFIPGFEGEAGADWSWLRDPARTALDASLSELRPGMVTVLGKPALIGTLGLMDWLSGLYERARGGRHGLLVLAVPGGVHEERVRLNERYNLPCTPDMAPVFFDLPEVPL